MKTNGKKTDKISNNYDVAVWENGDVSISLSGEMIFGTIGSQCGLQCNFDEYSDEFKTLLIACNTIANNFAVVDRIIKSKKDE